MKKCYINTNVVCVGPESTSTVCCIKPVSLTWWQQFNIIFWQVSFVSETHCELTDIMMAYVQACCKHELVSCSADGKTMQGIQEVGSVCARVYCICQLRAAVYWRSNLPTASWASETDRRNGVSALECLIISWHIYLVIYKTDIWLVWYTIQHTHCDVLSTWW